ncbi:MAG: transposase [Akkermansiaceae bacterium]|nr:transposase [Akkermansiaceae bacterium]
MQCDAYRVYKRPTRADRPSALIACLAHIRRGFVRFAQRRGPAGTRRLVVRLIGQLCRIEA